MKHRIPLFLRFLRSVLLVVFSVQFFYVVPFALSSSGCAAPQQQVNAPLLFSQMTLESLHEHNPKAFATTVCVLPDQVPPGTKFLLTDARLTQFVSDRNREAFRRFLPFADNILEFNPFARSSSAALLGTALHLSCPETFTVTHSPEEIEDGAPAEQTVIRISTSTHVELSSIVEQTCKEAALAGTNGRYLAQQTGQKHLIVLAPIDPPKELQIRRLLGVEKSPDPEPSAPRSVLRQLMDTPDGQRFGGVLSGVPIAVVPGGTIGADLAIEAGLLPPGTRDGRIGKACAEFGVGVVQIVVGCGGMGVGAGSSGTGVGAPVGTVVFVGSLGLTMAGVANCGNSIRHLSVELWRTEDSPGTRSTGSLAQVGPSGPTPVAAQPTTQSRATTPKAPETSLTVHKDPPVTKTTTTKRVKGKQAAGAEPTPVAKGAKRGPKTDPDAPHNAAIRAEADKLKAQGNVIVAGGGKPEEVVEITGGIKSLRRPDIIYRTPDGKLRGRNVGKTNADGTPVKREAEALDDLNNHSEVPTDFVSY